MKPTVSITFHIDDIAAFSGNGERTIENAIAYRTPGISTQRLVAIYHDYREHVDSARSRYGTDHYRRSEILMALKCGDEHQECLITDELAELAAAVDAIETNPELSAAGRRELMPVIGDFNDFMTWCDSNIARTKFRSAA